jgi:hypothetical protein
LCNAHVGTGAFARPEQSSAVAIYENAFVQLRRHLESAPAPGGDCHARLVLLLVRLTTDHPSAENRHLPRPQNAPRSRRTRSKSGSVGASGRARAAPEEIRGCLIFQIPPVRPHSDISHQRHIQRVNFFHLLFNQRSDNVQFAGWQFNEQLVVHLQSHT